MSEALIRWHVYANSDQLIKAVVNAIAAEAVRAISAAGSFLIVLAGGSTPRPIYARLVELDTPWDQWHVYFSDERCFPVGHRQRNDTMARDGTDKLTRKLGQMLPNITPVASYVAESSHPNTTLSLSVAPNTHFSL